MPSALAKRSLVILPLVIPAACASGGRGSAGADTSYDVVITGGRIVDGTGNSWYSGDVGMRRDRIASIAPQGVLANAPAAPRIDAHGRMTWLLALMVGLSDSQTPPYRDRT